MKNSNIFKIHEISEGVESGKKGFCFAISIKISDKEINLPLTKICYSIQDLEIEADAIRENLNLILRDAKARMRGESPMDEIGISSNMKSEDIWKILSTIQDDKLFADRFNTLDEKMRKSVADYVLTQCNIFSGKASVFSSRYNDKSGFLE